MVHGDGETGLENLKETFKDLDYSNNSLNAKVADCFYIIATLAFNKLIQASMGDQNIN